MKKQFYKKLNLVIVLLFICSYSFAQTFVFNNITYNVTSPTTVEVGMNSNLVGEYEIPENAIYQGDISYAVTSIGDSAFANNSELTFVYIPGTVTNIEDHAFDACVALTEITFPNSIVSIGDYAFKNCSVLTSITIPNSVTTIGTEAFKDCFAMTSIVISNSVTSIGEQAFKVGNNVISISVDIATPLTISASIFDGTYNAKLTVPKGSKAAYQAAEYWENFTNIVEFCTPTASTLNETACGSFFFNGAARTESGEYKDTLENADGCDSVITLNLTINDVPTAPTWLGSDPRCGKGSVYFYEYARKSSDSPFRIYATESSEEVIGTGLTSPEITETTDFWISYSGGTCESERVKYTAEVRITPAPTWLGSDPICGPGTVDFYLNFRMSIDSPYKIYATESSEEVLGTGLTTPQITESTDFWISSTEDGCESERVKYTAVVNYVYNENYESVSICGPGDLTFVAGGIGRLNRPSEASYAIYSNTGMQNQVSSDLTLTNVEASGTYYIVKTENGCTGEEIQVSAIVKEVPLVSATKAGSFITANVTSNVDIIDYTLLNCASAFELSSNANTIRVPNSSSYKVLVSANNGCTVISECIEVNILAGDINGNGIIENDRAEDITRVKGIPVNEIAGDVDLDGIINGSEIIGDLSGNYIIDGNEIEGDYNGNMRIDASENVVTSVSANKLATFTAYPNPASDVINVSFQVATSGNISIVNANGIEVSNQSINGTLVSVNTSSLTSGVYILKVNSNNGFATQQIVIAK